jgi:hypothetical protein
MIPKSEQSSRAGAAPESYDLSCARGASAIDHFEFCIFDRASLSNRRSQSCVDFGGTTETRLAGPGDVIYAKSSRSIIAASSFLTLPIAGPIVCASMRSAGKGRSNACRVSGSPSQAFWYSGVAHRP